MQKIFRLPAVIELSGLSRSSIYRLIKLGKFPAPVRIGEAATAWLEDDLKAWLESVSSQTPSIYKEAKQLLAVKAGARL